MGFSAYADDALCWVAGESAEEVGSQLEHLSSTIMDYANENFLALNEAKTQVLWCGTKGAPIRVGSCTVAPADRFEVLGVTFNKMLSPLPYINSLISSTKALTAVARRLSLHLPPEVLKSVMGSLYRGKIGYASLVLKPRLKESDSTSVIMSQLQVSVNNLARATIGATNSDRLKVEDLLNEAGFESLNRMTVYSIAMECWRALNLRDVTDGPLNPLGTILLTPSNQKPVSRTRAAANGCLPPPTKYQTDTFTWWAHTCWNTSPLLRSASTVTAAKKAAKMLALEAPI